MIKNLEKIKNSEPVLSSYMEKYAPFFSQFIHLYYFLQLQMWICNLFQFLPKNSLF